MSCSHIRWYFYVVFVIVLNCSSVFAGSHKGSDIEYVEISTLLQSAEAFVADNVAEKEEFHGLATYYNNITYFVFNENSFERMESNSEVILDEKNWLVVAGRFKILAVKGNGIKAKVSENKLSLQAPTDPNAITDAVALLASKHHVVENIPELNRVRYAHLWVGLAKLSMIVESVITIIHDKAISHWVVALALFALILRIVMFPLDYLTHKLKRQVSKIGSTIEPTIQNIKKNYDGQEAHTKLMAVYKDQGVSPFYTLKPISSSFIQIPVLIAVFNALGEMPQFTGQSVWWIRDFAYPDEINYLPFVVPMLGNKVSILPVMMTLVSLVSTYFFVDKCNSAFEAKRQKLSLIFMSLAFLVLFYPFPAVMVFYWTLSNFLQVIFARWYA